MIHDTTKFCKTHPPPTNTTTIDWYESIGTEWGKALRVVSYYKREWLTFFAVGTTTRTHAQTLTTAMTPALGSGGVHWMDAATVKSLRQACAYSHTLVVPPASSNLAALGGVSDIIADCASRLLVLWGATPTDIATLNTLLATSVTAATTGFPLALVRNDAGVAMLPGSPSLPASPAPPTESDAQPLVASSLPGDALVLYRVGDASDSPVAGFFLPASGMRPAVLWLASGLSGGGGSARRRREPWDEWVDVMSTTVFSVAAPSSSRLATEVGDATAVPPSDRSPPSPPSPSPGSSDSGASDGVPAGAIGGIVISTLFVFILVSSCVVASVRGSCQHRRAAARPVAVPHDPAGDAAPDELFQQRLNHHNMHHDDDAANATTVNPVPLAYPADTFLESHPFGDTNAPPSYLDVVGGQTVASGGASAPDALADVDLDECLPSCL